MKTLEENNATKNACPEYFLLIYTVCVSIFAIALFLYAFFPITYHDNKIATMDNVPKFIEHTRIKLPDQYEPAFDKVVIMVIDALRWDFVSGESNYAAMPNVNSLLKSNAGCLLKTIVTPPTVTMPRIKAMMTGTVPNFADVALNFGADSISTDSLLNQAKNHGHKLVFYGDETWLKLFPDMFHRHEGTTSFFVTDFTEVDTNVTRQVKVELQKTDWSVMILHYLGLDHIGHVSGPFSSLIEPKLREMDEIIHEIHSQLINLNNNNIRTLFLVCGDHGMKDSGGHGGATPEETLVPLVAFGTSCLSNTNQGREISQIDMAVTLSVLMGIPIPFANLGRISLDLINNLPTVQKLFALHYNSKQLLHHFQQLPDYENQKPFKNYIKAVKLHSIWLNTNIYQDSIVEDIVAAYNDALNGMKSALVNNPIKYDILIMVVTIIFMCQILYVNIRTPNFAYSPSLKKIFQVFMISTGLWAFLSYFLKVDEKTSLFSGGLNNLMFITIPSICILISNCILCAKCNYPAKIEKQEHSELQFLLHAGAIVHAVSLASSSFVEEEHQTWYFYWVTLLLFFICDTTNLFTPLKRSVQSKKPFEYILFFSLLALLICHRVIRKLNSTGDKWAHLPDMTDWLQSQESKIGISLLLITGLALLVWLDYYFKKTSKMSIAIVAMSAILIYLRHSASKSVIGASFLPNSRGIWEVRLFWLLMLLDLLLGIRQIRRNAQINNKNFTSPLLFLLLRCWIQITAVLHNSSNLILLPMHIMAGGLIHRLCEKYDKHNIGVLLYILSGNVFYFYQGNSNSLATVNVAAGYIGLESYRPIVTGFFLFVNTYSSQVLALLMCLYDGSVRNPLQTSKIMLPICQQYVTWRMLPMAAYAVIVTIQRYHLFVWSVFSPKLMYEAAHCVFLFFIILVLQLIFLFHDLLR